MATPVLPLNWYSASLPGLSMEKAGQPCCCSHSLSFQLQPTLLLSNFTSKTKNESNRGKMFSGLLTIARCSDSTPAAAVATTTTLSNALPVMKKKRRYRKHYPGEKEGITEEMRFVAMRLRNTKGRKTGSGDGNEADDVDVKAESVSASEEDEEDGGAELWQPSMEGFIKYIVDSKLVFNTIERIVDESDDVSYAYFRRTGLERSGGLSKDLEWFSQQDIVIPPPNNPGVIYAKYLEELAERSAPLFLSHFYNIYFSHIAGGQVIAKRVSEKLLEGRELEFYRWDGDSELLLKSVREKLNMLGEHWSRDEKNKCLREATKSFRFLGQIIRLIIL